MLYEPESDEEREFLFSYKARAVQYPRTEVTVDAVVLWRAGVGDDWDVLLIKRKGWPYKGMWALPGGFLDQNETALEGVLRELKEETGLDAVVWDVVQMPVAGWLIYLAVLFLALYVVVWLVAWLVDTIQRRY
jgi:8-oxo-dGTP diphosphatase